MKLNSKDKQLIKEATEVAKSNCDIYADIGLHVGAVVLAKSGKVYRGINLKTSHSVCAEQVAIGQAFACGEREFETIVAVKLDENGEGRVVSPCGVCRYFFDKFSLDFNIIVEDIETGEVLKVKAKDLLPYPYRREQKCSCKSCKGKE